MRQLGQIIWKCNVQSGWPHLMHLWTLFPRLPFFFLWLKPSSSLRQVQHLFCFPRLEGGLSIQTPWKSAINYCAVQAIAQCMQVLEEWSDQLHYQFQTKKDELILRIFGVLLLFNLDSVAAFTKTILRMCENAATVHLDDFGLTKYFSIFWSTMSVPPLM